MATLISAEIPTFPYRLESEDFTSGYWSKEIPTDNNSSHISRTLNPSNKNEGLGIWNDYIRGSLAINKESYESSTQEPEKAENAKKKRLGTETQNAQMRFEVIEVENTEALKNITSESNVFKLVKFTNDNQNNNKVFLVCNNCYGERQSTDVTNRLEDAIVLSSQKDITLASLTTGVIEGTLNLKEKLLLVVKQQALLDDAHLAGLSLIDTALKEKKLPRGTINNCVKYYSQGLSTAIIEGIKVGIGGLSQGINVVPKTWDINISTDKSGTVFSEATINGITFKDTHGTVLNLPGVAVCTCQLARDGFHVTCIDASNKVLVNFIAGKYGNISFDKIRQLILLADVEENLNKAVKKYEELSCTKKTLEESEIIELLRACKKCKEICDAAANNPLLQEDLSSKELKARIDNIVISSLVQNYKSNWKNSFLQHIEQKLSPISTIAFRQVVSVSNEVPVVENKNSLSIKEVGKIFTAYLKAKTLPSPLSSNPPNDVITFLQNLVKFAQDVKIPQQDLFNYLVTVIQQLHIPLEQQLSIFDTLIDSKVIDVLNITEFLKWLGPVITSLSLQPNISSQHFTSDRIQYLLKLAGNLCDRDREQLVRFVISLHRNILAHLSYEQLTAIASLSKKHLLVVASSPRFFRELTMYGSWKSILDGVKEGWEETEKQELVKYLKIPTNVDSLQYKHLEAFFKIFDDGQKFNIINAWLQELQKSSSTSETLIAQNVKEFFAQYVKATIPENYPNLLEKISSIEVGLAVQANVTEEQKLSSPATDILYQIRKDINNRLSKILTSTSVSTLDNAINYAGWEGAARAAIRNEVQENRQTVQNTLINLSEPQLVDHIISIQDIPQRNSVFDLMGVKLSKVLEILRDKALAVPSDTKVLEVLVSYLTDKERAITELSAQFWFANNELMTKDFILLLLKEDNMQSLSADNIKTLLSKLTVQEIINTLCEITKPPVRNRIFEALSPDNLQEVLLGLRDGQDNQKSILLAYLLDSKSFEKFITVSVSSDMAETLLKNPAWVRQLSVDQLVLLVNRLDSRNAKITDIFAAYQNVASENFEKIVQAFFDNQSNKQSDKNVIEALSDDKIIKRLQQLFAENSRLLELRNSSIPISSAGERAALQQGLNSGEGIKPVRDSIVQLLSVMPIIRVRDIIRAVVGNSNEIIDHLRVNPSSLSDTPADLLKSDNRRKLLELLRDAPENQRGASDRQILLTYLLEKSALSDEKFVKNFVTPSFAYWLLTTPECINALSSDALAVIWSCLPSLYGMVLGEANIDEILVNHKPERISPKRIGGLVEIFNALSKKNATYIVKEKQVSAVLHEKNIHRGELTISHLELLCQQAENTPTFSFGNIKETKETIRFSVIAKSLTTNGLAQVISNLFRAVSHRITPAETAFLQLAFNSTSFVLTKLSEDQQLNTLPLILKYLPKSDIIDKFNSLKHDRDAQLVLVKALFKSGVEIKEIFEKFLDGSEKNQNVLGFFDCAAANNVSTMMEILLEKNQKKFVEFAEYLAKTNIKILCLFAKLIFEKPGFFSVLQKKAPNTILAFLQVLNECDLKNIISSLLFPDNIKLKASEILLSGLLSNPKRRNNSCLIDLLFNTAPDSVGSKIINYLSAVGNEYNKLRNIIQGKIKNLYSVEEFCGLSSKERGSCILNLDKMNSCFGIVNEAKILEFVAKLDTNNNENNKNDTVLHLNLNQFLQESFRILNNNNVYVSSETLGKVISEILINDGTKHEVMEYMLANNRYLQELLTVETLKKEKGNISVSVAYKSAYKYVKEHWLQNQLEKLNNKTFGDKTTDIINSYLQLCTKLIRSDFLISTERKAAKALADKLNKKLGLGLFRRLLYRAKNFFFSSFRKTSLKNEIEMDEMKVAAEPTEQRNGTSYAVMGAAGLLQQQVEQPKQPLMPTTEETVPIAPVAQSQIPVSVPQGQGTRSMIATTVASEQLGGDSANMTIASPKCEHPPLVIANHIPSEENFKKFLAKLDTFTYDNGKNTLLKLFMDVLQSPQKEQSLSLFSDLLRILAVKAYKDESEVTNNSIVFDPDAPVGLNSEEYQKYQKYPTNIYDRCVEQVVNGAYLYSDELDALARKLDLGLTIYDLDNDYSEPRGSKSPSFKVGISHQGHFWEAVLDEKRTCVQLNSCDYPGYIHHDGNCGIHSFVTSFIEIAKKYNIQKKSYNDLVQELKSIACGDAVSIPTRESLINEYSKHILSGARPNESALNNDDKTPLLSAVDS